MLSVDVALHTGRPVVYELVRKPPVDVARVERLLVPPPAPPKMSWPSPTEERPVPPTSTESVEDERSVPLELAVTTPAPSTVPMVPELLMLKSVVVAVPFDDEPI